jgi:hypothetical protein
MPRSHGHSWSKNPVPDCSETATEKSVKSFRLITSECFAVRAEFALTAATQLSPAQPDRHGKNGGTSVAGIRVVVTALDIDLGLLMESVCQSAANIVSAGTDGIG